MLTLIIKGDMAAAYSAADAHGVELFSSATHNKFKEIIASTRSENLSRVTAWFAEPGEAPYAPGTLMFYSEPDASGAFKAEPLTNDER